MITLAIAAPYLVPLLYGDQWTKAVLPLQVLCAAGYFRALYHVGGIVAQSVGQVYRELARQLLYAALVVAGSLLGIRYGLAGVAAGVAVAILVMYTVMAELSLTLTGASWRDYLMVQRRAALATLITGATAWTTRWALAAAVQSDAVVAVGTLAAAAIPSGIAILRLLAEPEASALQAQLPQWCHGVVKSTVFTDLSTAVEG